MVFEGPVREQAESIVARYPRSRSALLPLLYLAQSVEGHLSREGMREVGELLGLTTAEVEAVATYYTMYRREPAGRWLLSVCTNVSCALLGARDVHEAARGAAGGDEDVEVEEVECLGACDAAPVVQVNYCNYDRVSEEGVVELIEALRAGEPPPPARGPKPAPHGATSRILAGLGDDRE
ncbi:MAG TPA: NAD(P)H-dependent oxidoreductase subunit E [Actinomycetota bacterium]